MPQGQGNMKHETKPAEPPPDKPAWRSLPQMRYQNAYVWIVFFSFMDVLLTWLILLFGEDAAMEINPVARFVIDGWGGMRGLGMAGASGLKFTLVVLAIVICEIVGRSRDRKGRRLAWVLVVIAAVPVFWSLGLLLMNQAILSGVE